MNLDPEIDLIVNVSDLTSEFRTFPTTFYRYCLQKAKAEAQRDHAKAKLKEIRAVVYKRIKSDTSTKHTEKSMEAEIDTDPQVLEAQLKLVKAEHDAATIEGAVESMRSKKDMLMQLGADRRKEN